MKTLKQLLDEKAEKLDAIKAIEDAAKAEQRTLTEDEAATVDNLIEMAEALAAEAAKLKTDEERTARISSLRVTPAGERTPRRPGRQPQGQQAEQRTAGDVEIHPDLGRYSLIRAIGRRMQNLPVDGLEGEVSREIEQRSGRAATGFFMPLMLPMMAAAGMFGAEQRTALNTTTGAGALVNTTMPTLIEYLRSRLVMVKLGAQLIPDLVGTVDFPKETNEGSYSWEAEAGDVNEDSPTIGQVTLSPLTLGAYCDFTRRFLSQSGFGAEAFARNRLAKSIALGIDAAAINGDSSNKPTGILQNSDCPTVEIGDDGGPITWAKMVELETAVAHGNADEGVLNYLTSPRGRGQFKTIERGSSGLYIEEGGQSNGYDVHSSTLVPINLTKGAGEDLTAVIFGNFAQVLIGLFSAVDVLVDPYTLGKSGGARVIAMQDVDVDVAQPGALAKIVDMHSVAVDEESSS